MFKNKYQKRYASVEEEAQRQQIFMENVQRMRDYQAAHPDATFSMAINHLADRRMDVGVMIDHPVKHTTVF